MVSPYDNILHFVSSYASLEGDLKKKIGLTAILIDGLAKKENVLLPEQRRDCDRDV